MNYTTNNLSCDILIAGGGIGGLCCAVSLKERLPEADILVVEKQTSGYSGKANKGGGVLQYFDPAKVKPEDFAVFHANEIGAFLGDQELMMRYVAMNGEMLDTLDRWGVNVPKREDGTYNVMPTGPMTAMVRVDLDITLRVRRKAESLGVRFMDKTVVSDLLTENGEIRGATAYSILDNNFYVISAKSVVMATGSQNYRIGSMWSSGRGDGTAAAYRAGAELRNVEFGNFAQLARIRSHNEVVFGENNMYNAQGEFITPHFRSTRETDINSNAIREWYLQMTAGTGPVHLEFGPPPGAPRGGAPAGGPPAGGPPAGGPPKGAPAGGPPAGGAAPKREGQAYGTLFRRLNDQSASKVDTDMEVCPMFIGEQSPIRVGHDMQTSIRGLYAIGDCSYAGSAVPGAVPAPPGRNRGSGILNAVFAALVCAEAIGSTGLPAGGAVCEKMAEEMAKRAYAPLERESGCTAKDVIALVQKAMAPMENSVYMREDRMLAALKIVEEAKALCGSLKADDLHGLLSCHEAEAMVLAAELHYRASLLRKESRGWFLREDYPEMDNENWLKWIIAKNVDGEMTFTTVPVPIENYPAQPAK